MIKVLLPIGFAAEAMDTLYPFFRIREEGYQAVVAGPEFKPTFFLRYPSCDGGDHLVEGGRRGLTGQSLVGPFPGSLFRH